MRKNGMLDIKKGFKKMTSVLAVTLFLGAFTNTAFAALTCGDCHGNPPVDNATRDGSTGRFPGSHDKHAGSSYLNRPCTVCHVDNTIPGHRNSNIEMASPINGDSGASYSKTASFPQTNAAFSGGTCNGVYCHSTVQGADGTGAGLDKPQSWGAAGPLVCSACHADMSGASATGKHVKHTNSTSGNYNMPCANCHPNYTYNSPDNSVHADKSINVTPPTGSYSGGTTPGDNSAGGGYGSCSSVYCHSNGNPPSGNSYTTIAWNGAAGCGDCHKTAGLASDMLTVGTPTLMSSPHVQHVASDRYGQNTLFTCNTCHSATASNNSTISTPTEHADGQKDVALNGTAGGNWSGTQCSNTYCHSKGTSTSGSHAALSWSGTTDTECDSCHGGNALATTTTGTGPITTNAHAAHTNDSANQVGFNINCIECHHATVSGDRTIASRVYHVNKTLNIRFDNGTRNKDADSPTYNSLSAQSNVAGGATANPGSQASCGKVYCHSSGNLDAPTGGSIVVSGSTPTYKTPAWNTGTLTCTGCHGDSSANKAHPVYTTGTGGSTTANSHTTHVDGQGYTCDFCHNQTTTSTSLPPTAVTNGGLHLNRVENVNIKTMGGLNGTWDGAVNAKTCTATYCHGTGASPKWGEGASGLNCGTCHQSQGANGTASYAPKHQKHVETAGYDFSCEICHAIAGTNHAQGASTGSNPGGDAVDANQTAQISFTALSSGTWSTGRTYRGSSATYRFRALNENPYGAAAPTPAYTNANTNSGTDTTNSAIKYITDGSCSNIWCHSNANPVQGSTNTYSSVLWNDTPGCGSCHKTAAALATMQTAGTPNRMSNAHEKHAATDRYSYTCDECHAFTVPNDSSASVTTGATSSHVNAAKDWKFSTTVKTSAINQSTAGTYAGSGGACSSTYCHSKGQSTTSPFTTPLSAIRWDAGYNSSTCTTCHGGKDTYSNVNTNGPIGQHKRHIGTDTGYNYNCDECHAETVSNDSSTALHATTGYGKHVDTVKDWKFSTTVLATAYSQATGNYATGTCSNIYCHSTGVRRTANPATYPYTGTDIAPYQTPTWTGTLTNCNGCHGDATYTTGRPDYTNTAPKANSHVAHGSKTCDICHYPTTHDGATIFDRTKHVNMSYDIGNAASTLGYSAGTLGADGIPAGGTCSGTFGCHGDYQWGGPSMTCVSCHSAVLGGRRQITATGTQADGSGGSTGGDFVRSSRHVSNGTTSQIVLKWDCIVCHLEGNPSTGATSSDHAMTTNADVNLRNVDSYAAGWIWNGSGTVDTTMRNNMDNFCLGCHDSNGASTIAVNNSNSGIATGATVSTTVRTVTGAGNSNTLSASMAQRPFNTNDTLQNARDTATTGNNGTTVGAFRLSSYGRVLNVKSQFNSGGASGTGWASHHNLNVFSLRYGTRNTTAWPQAAWTTYTTKEGVVINDNTNGGEKAGLHCSDCHLNEANAHGAASSWYMLAGSNTASDDDVVPTTSGAHVTTSEVSCFRCHNSAVYATDGGSGTSGAVHDHDTRCANLDVVTGTAIEAPFGNACHGCHGGYGDTAQAVNKDPIGTGSATVGRGSLGSIHGNNETYNPAAGTNSSKRYRFMSGASMRYYNPNGSTAYPTTETPWGATGSVGCYTLGSADQWGSCTKHSGGTTQTKNRARSLSY